MLPVVAACPFSSSVCAGVGSTSIGSSRSILWNTRRVTVNSNNSTFLLDEAHSCVSFTGGQWYGCETSPTVTEYKLEHLKSSRWMNYYGISCNNWLIATVNKGCFPCSSCVCVLIGCSNIWLLDHRPGPHVLYENDLIHHCWNILHFSSFKLFANMCDFWHDFS